MYKKIVIFGVGLIGGSFALALKKAGAVEQVVGVGRTVASLERAKELGIIDVASYSIEEALADAELVLLAAPVAQTARLLAAIKPHLQPDTIVTDAGSTKTDVVGAAYKMLGEKVAQFVPGHPIAGRELNGPDAAVADLYMGKKVVLTALPENSEADIERVADAWTKCGALIHRLTPQQHDCVFASVSHLPHLLAYALVDDIAKKPHANLLFQYAASGFRDFTRIAGSSPEMWRDISLANQPALLNELDAYILQLVRMRKMLATNDGFALEGVYANAQYARQSWIQAIEAGEKQGKKKRQLMKHYPSYIELRPAVRAEGAVRLPGSKSISNRTLLLAALANGSTRIMDLLASDDTHVMLMALQKLGVKWTQIDETQHFIVNGANGLFPVRHADLFMGNAGTAIRPLTAVLAVMGGDYTLHGVSRMHERPIGDLVDALNAIGARIEYTGTPGYPPLHVQRGHISAPRLQVRGNVSSQFLTALLMAAPLMARDHAVTIDVIGELISKPYIDITLNLMRRFGVQIEQQGWQSFTIGTGQAYQSLEAVHVEGDASSASYFLAAGAIAGGPVRVEGVGNNSIQGDVRFVDALEQMGATITMGDNWIESRSNGVLKAIDADFNHIPDAAMTIAVAALYADGPSVLRNIGSWRVKETDRIAAMATELRKLGAQVEEGADYLRITPPVQMQPAAIDTYDDHRMAMCFSLASLDGAALQGAAVRINDPKCVAKTFPEYFEAFAKIAKKELL